MIVYYISSIGRRHAAGFNEKQREKQSRPEAESAAADADATAAADDQVEGKEDDGEVSCHCGRFGGHA